MIDQKPNDRNGFSTLTQTGGLILLLALATQFAACTRGSVVRDDKKAAAISATDQVRDFDVQMLDGPKIKLSELTAQNKVIVFDFWASWCGPCKIEIPHLVELQKDYKDKGVEVVGLVIQDTEDKIRAFTKEMPMNYRIGFAAPGMFEAFSGGYSGIPQTLIFDRSGKLIKHMKGIPRDPAALRSMLRDSVDKALQQS